MLGRPNKAVQPAGPGRLMPVRARHAAVATGIRAQGELPDAVPAPDMGPVVRT
jgi:hypothetical protein